MSMFVAAGALKSMTPQWSGSIPQVIPTNFHLSTFLLIQTVGFVELRDALDSKQNSQLWQIFRIPTLFFFSGWWSGTLFFFLSIYLDFIFFRWVQTTNFFFHFSSTEIAPCLQHRGNEKKIYVGRRQVTQWEGSRLGDVAWLSGFISKHRKHI